MMDTLPFIQFNYRQADHYKFRMHRASARILTIQISGELPLSKTWKITYNTRYHFESKQFTQTNVGISRGLHLLAYESHLGSVGKFQSYNFTIAVKASVLQDLKLERRKRLLDNL